MAVRRLVIPAFFTILLLGLLFFAGATKPAQSRAVEDTRGDTSQESVEYEVDMTRPIMAILGPSFESKEKAEFLLTVPLLVQDQLSGDVIPLYANE